MAEDRAYCLRVFQSLLQNRQPFFVLGQQCDRGAVHRAILENNAIACMLRNNGELRHMTFVTGRATGNVAFSRGWVSEG